MAQWQVIVRGNRVQKAGLVSGLVLFAFALTHFVNHALGMVDLEIMQAFQDWRTVVTRSWIGTIVLATALVVHVIIALVKIATRSTFRLEWWELLQICLGLLIPFLLLPHIVNTRVASSAFGVRDSYLYELARLWPSSALLQSTLLLFVWVHACIGIHHWLKLNAAYRAIMPALLFVAIAVPLSALAGFMVGGRAVAQLIQDPAMFQRVKELTAWPDGTASDQLAFYRTAVRIGFLLCLLAVAAVIAARHVSQRAAAARLTITYQGGPIVSAPIGPSLLEISRMHKVPHASVCGGRARCSTCRVRIDTGADKLTPPAFAEAFTLASIGAPQNVRLACQIRPKTDLTVTRILRAGSASPRDADLQETDAAGVEKPLAILFLDMRNFTQMSQSRLPYDVVYILNEFFSAVGDAIVSHGGWIDKLLGDGLLAIFGREQGVEVGCRQALRAARAIDLALDHVNAKLEAEIGQPLRVGMGIHAGPILLGRIGFGDAVDMTVVGTAVNVASRLEQLAKEKKCQIMMSRAVAEYAGWYDYEGHASSVEVRGVPGQIAVVGIERGRDLPITILSSTLGEERAGASARGR